MPLWEYKIISSGKGGFATPVLLEKFLNDLGREDWEIIEFRTPPDNPLAFNGLARRTTQRDWTLQDAAAAAAKAEAEKLRAEFEAKFKAAASNAPAADAAPDSFIAEKAAPEDGFRKPVDTSRDSDPDAGDDEGEKTEWDQLNSEDELPSFFDALKPHMRRNQRGPGQSVGTDYLAKKWDLAEEDVKGALVECGLQIPADENAKPVYVEYDGDLYWVNINRRGELWINTREKPRPVFRVVQAQRVVVDDEPKAEARESNPAREPREGREAREGREPREGREAREPRGEAKAETKPEGASASFGADAATETSAAQPEAAKPDGGAAKPGQSLPAGEAVLAKIRPHMRRNRRGPGGSGSTSFLARALRTTEADLLAAFTTLGLKLPENPNDKPVYTELVGQLWWLNQDSRGGVWINGRDKRADDAPKADAPAAPVAGEAAAPEGATPAATPSGSTTEPGVAAPTETPAPTMAETAAVQPEPLAEAIPPVVPTAVPTTEQLAAPLVAGSPLAAVRLLLKETKTGGFAGKVDRVAEDLAKSADDLVAALVAAGLKVPEKSREKPVFVELGGEIFWFNRNAKDELWINAKASKFGGDEEGEAGEKRSRRPRSRKKDDEAGGPETVVEASEGPGTPAAEPTAPKAE